MFRCWMATRLPSVIVRAARITKSGCQLATAGRKAVLNKRKSSAKPAAFDATAMKAVMGVGAPSYTSGVHMWKGTAATLNPSPAVTSTRPTSKPVLLISWLASACAMAAYVVLPVIP